MVRVSASPSLLAAAGFCGLYCSYAGAVVAKPGNLSSRVNSTGVHGGSVHSTHSQDALETSQTRVNQVDGPPPSDGLRSSVNRASSKGKFILYNQDSTQNRPKRYSPLLDIFLKRIVFSTGFWHIIIIPWVSQNYNFRGIKNNTIGLPSLRYIMLTTFTS